MRNLLAFSAVALAIVVGVSYYAVRVMQDVKRYEKEVRAEGEACAAALRGLAVRFPFTAPGALDGKRFRAYVESRVLLAVAVDMETTSGGKRNPIESRRARNRVLRRFTRGLEERRMSLEEYLWISERWQAVLAARPSTAPGLAEAWKRKVGRPLPDAAAEIAPAEREVLADQATGLEVTLAADRFEPVLRSVLATPER